MRSKWLEIQLSLADDATDLVSQALTDLGCTGVTAAEKALDTFVVPSADSLANDPVVRAYFPFPDDPEALCAEIKKALIELEPFCPGVKNSPLVYRELADHDWASDWKQHFPPFKVGKKLVICPSWIDWQRAGDETVLTLDPGQAFGTGTHATTGLCLAAIAECYSSATPPEKVLDVGTGSGILAMACAALGAQEVVACDIDNTACLVAQENVATNKLDKFIIITDTPLGEITGRYALVLANILAAENIRLATPLVERLATHGRLILSGILVEQEERVVNCFAHYPLTLLSTHHEDEWSCIVYQRHE